MLMVFEPGAPNCYIFFRPILLTLSIFENLISTHLPLSGFLDSILCDLIVPTPGLAFSLVMPRTLAAASSFLSDRTYPSLNFLSPLFFCLTSTRIMYESTSFKTTSPLSHFLIIRLPLFSLHRRMAKLTSFLPPFFPPPEISLFWGLQLPSPPLGLKRYFRPPWRENIGLGDLL